MSAIALALSCTPLVGGPAAAAGLASGPVDTILRRPALVAVDATVPPLESSAAAAPGEFAAGARIENAQPPLGVPILGGLLGGGLGVVGGAMIGASVTDGQDEFTQLGVILSSAFVGEVLLLPLGVHLGNDRRGSYASDLGVSLLAGLAAIGLASLAGEGGFALGVSLQVGLVVAQERHTAGHRLEQAAAASP